MKLFPREPSRKKKYYGDVGPDLYLQLKRIIFQAHDDK